MSNKISGEENCGASLRKCHWWSWMTHRYLTGKREAEVKIKNRIRSRSLSYILHLRCLWCEKASSCGDARADHLLRGRVLPLMQRACTSARACVGSAVRSQNHMHRHPERTRWRTSHFQPESIKKTKQKTVIEKWICFDAKPTLLTRSLELTVPGSQGFTQSACTNSIQSDPVIIMFCKVVTFCTSTAASIICESHWCDISHDWFTQELV